MATDDVFGPFLHFNFDLELTFIISTNHGHQGVLFPLVNELYDLSNVSNPQSKHSSFQTKRKEL